MIRQPPLEGVAGKPVGVRVPPSAPVETHRRSVVLAPYWFRRVLCRDSNRRAFADLYAPVSMPPELARAHADLDTVVDKGYGRTAFASEMERVAFLFERYEALTRPLPPPTRPPPKKAWRSGAKLLFNPSATEMTTGMILADAFENP